MKVVLPLLLLLAALAAQAQVRSLTIGVDVNSPYGISEPWIMIREGLLRLDSIEFVSAQPDRKTATGEMRTRDGRVPDVERLGNALRDIGAGASLRGVEATIDGKLDKQDGRFVIRVGGTGEVLLLAAATRRVHLAAGKKSAEPLTDAERNAFDRLTAKWKGQPLEMRVTGSLVKASDQTAANSPPDLEVRRFDLR